jgi:hypothetical protein
MWNITNDLPQNYIGKCMERTWHNRSQVRSLAMISPQKLLRRTALWLPLIKRHYEEYLRVSTQNVRLQNNISQLESEVLKVTTAYQSLDRKGGEVRSEAVELETHQPGSTLHRTLVCLDEEVDAETVELEIYRLRNDLHRAIAQSERERDRRMNAEATLAKLENKKD